MSVDQAKRMVAGPTKNGIIASRPAMTDGAGVVIADTYSLDWGQTEFKATDKLVSVTKTYNQVGTTYRGNFYVIADTDSEVGGKVFATQIVETIEQPGDIARANPSHDSGNSKTATTTSKAPATGDALVPITIALLCIAIGSLLVAVRRARNLKRCD